MKSDGIMTKGVGLHSVNRATYRSQVKCKIYKKTTTLTRSISQIPSLSFNSKNPRPETIARVEERKELRVRIADSFPGKHHLSG
jgi:hypothetical protein